jgi:predicted MFS family arabinose efflux permease
MTKMDSIERRQLGRLAIAELAVLVGGQAWFVTLTWLLIQRGSPGSTIAFVLMVGAVPRAVLMLIGGAVTDRYSPVVVLRITTVAMAGLIAVAAAAMAHGPIAIWQLAVLAALLGATDAFYFPAVGGLIPQLVGPERRNQANAVLQLCDQITQIVGPVMAGVLIARAGEVTTLAAIGACFTVGVIAVLAMRAGRGAAPIDRPPAVGQAILEALRFVWRTPDVRLCLVVAAALSLGTVGPISVGGALLANQRLGGAHALGVLLGGFGIGAFVGVLVAGATRAPRSVSTVLAVTTAAIGVGIGALGLASSLIVACAIAAPTGVAAGYLGVAATTVLQQRTPPAMQGRTSSLLMFAFFALDPVSQGLSGLLVGFGVGPLFGIAGAVLVGAGVLVACSSERT